MEPDALPRAPAGLRIREFETPALPPRARRLVPLKVPAHVIVEVY